MSNSRLMSLAAVLACLFASGVCQAVERTQRLPVEVAAVAYESVGIGDEDLPIKTLEYYNLRTIFAVQGSGEYLAGIRLLIEDTKGRKVLERESPGPIFYVKLPAGSYRMTASYGGKSLSKPAIVKEQKRSDLYFYWPD